MLISSLALASVVLQGSSTVTAKPYEYRSADGTVLEGYVAFDSAKTGKRPIVLIVHDWDGLTDYEMRRAQQIARMGYVGFAVDVYGKGVRPTGAERGATAGKYRNDVSLFRQRLKAAFDAGTTMPEVDRKRVAAIGYCFGGGGVLEMGRSGLAIDALVSFHGSVAPDPEDKNIKGNTLVLHGAADKSVPPSQVEAFARQMQGLKKPVRVVMYEGAEHSFTVPSAAKPGSGSAYDPAADRDSFGQMLGFLRVELGR